MHASFTHLTSDGAEPAPLGDAAGESPWAGGTERVVPAGGLPLGAVVQAPAAEEMDGVAVDLELVDARRVDEALDLRRGHTARTGCKPNLQGRRPGRTCGENSPCGRNTHLIEWVKLT